MKSLFQKRITAVTSLKGSLKGFLIACCFITSVIALLFRSRWAFVVALVVGAFTLLYHLTMGKLILKNGDVALFLGFPALEKPCF